MGRHFLSLPWDVRLAVYVGLSMFGSFCGKIVASIVM